MKRRCGKSRLILRKAQEIGWLFQAVQASDMFYIAEVEPNCNVDEAEYTRSPEDDARD